MRYFLRENGGTTCCSDDTPSYLPICLANYKEITKEEYEALMPKETLVFRDNEETIDESCSTDLSYLYEDEPVKSNSSDVTEPVEEVVMPIAKNPHRL